MLPEPTSWSKPFWEGIADRELRLPWCQRCDQPHFPPRPFCPHCWNDDLTWQRSSGRGTVYSYTEVRAYPPSSFQDRLPYVIAIVRLAEGVQMLTNIVGDSADIDMDREVEVRFEERDGDVLPVFAVRGEDSS